MVFVIVAVFLLWFAIVSMQIFGYLDAEEQCSRFGSDQFGNIFKVSCSHLVLFDNGHCHYQSPTHTLRPGVGDCLTAD